MMKKILTIVSVVLLLSCGDDEVVQFSNERMYVIDREVVLDAEVTGAFVGVDANCQWTAKLTDAWEHLTVNPIQGGVNIVSPVNTMPQHRSATLTITSQSGKLVQTVIVSQNAGDVSIEVTPDDDLQFIGEEDVAVIRVVSNADWTLSGDGEWCHVSPTSGQAGETVVSIQVDANPNETTRRKPLVFSAGGGEARQTLTAIQAPPSTLRFATTESVIRATATAASYQIGVAGTAEWTPMSDQSWAHIVSPLTSVTGEGVITVSCDNNLTLEPKRATVTLVWSRMVSIPVQITIEQAAAKLPNVGAVTVSGIDRRMATVHASYSSEFPVTQFGIYYTTDRNRQPNLDDTDNVVSYEGSQLSGEFSVNLTNLASGRRYYVYTFAKSAVGITYSAEPYSFVTTGDTPDEDDITTPSY